MLIVRLFQATLNKHKSSMPSMIFVFVYFKVGPNLKYSVHNYVIANNF